MRIDVMKEDIRGGEVRCSERCPVAKAVMRATGRDWASVGPDHLLCAGRSPYQSHRAVLPSYIGQWINDFDNGKPVQPIAFDLEFNPPL